MFFFQNSKFKIQNSFQGFTLIETLVLLFIFSVIAVTFFETYAVGTRLIIDSKDRLGATALANQKMEIIRSIDYDTLGTKHLVNGSWVYGVPAGDILQDETIGVNTTSYTVHTFVQYVDDPFDGQAGGSPNDTIPNDYKRVRLTVSWGDGSSGRTIALFSNIAPNGIETSVGGGVLSINILNAAGAGVPSATVHIVNSSASIDLTTQTDSTGNITLPATPIGTQKYAMTVSKSGYYGAVTYAPYPTTTFNPTDIHASVVAAKVNQKVILIDQSANITLKTEDPFGTAIPSINFHIEGGRILGIVPSTNPAQPVYGLVSDTSTDVSGTKTVANQSYGSYTITPSTSAYTFYKLSPDSLDVNKLDVSAGVDVEEKIILLDKAAGSLLVRVTSATSNTIIQNATVQLTNSTLGYDITLTTDKFGYVYFPTALPALTSGTYDIKTSATGFQDKTGSIAVSGSLKTEDVKLSVQ